MKEPPRERPSARGLRVAIVRALFNRAVTDGLLEGALAALDDMGAGRRDVAVFDLPGAFELPLAAAVAARSGRFDAVVALGAVVRGETDHYDHVAGSVTSGVAQVGLSTGVPTIFGILTTDTLEQALERAGAKAGNKGWDAALSAIELAQVVGQLSGKRRASK